MVHAENGFNPRRTQLVAGRTVCFTGELGCTCHDKKFTRNKAERVVAEAGFEVAKLAP